MNPGLKSAVLLFTLTAAPALAQESADAADSIPPAPAATMDGPASVPLPDSLTLEDLATEDQIAEEMLADEESSDLPVGYGQVEGLTVDRVEARQVFSNYMLSEQYGEAIEAAQVGLDLTRDEFGINHPETVPYLNDLGNAYLRSGDPGNARLHFEQSVSIVKDRVGIFSQKLVEPLMGMGLAFQDMGEHNDAIGSFQYAQHVTHRTTGVNNLEQLPMIEAATESFMATEQWQQAENLQLFAYKLHRRTYGKGSAESLPGLYRLARWYQQIQDYRQARNIYRDGLEIIAATGGEDSPAMIPALKGIAGAYLEENGPEKVKGLKTSERILAIINAHPEQFSADQRILAHLEMGDWYVHYNYRDDAWSHYRSAWELAGTESESERDWMAFFDRPHLIYPGATLGLDLLGYGRVGDEVYYDFEFTIGRDGRPQDISILGTNLHGQTRAAALQAFRAARFRPRIVEGETVTTPGFKVRRVYPTGAPRGHQELVVGVSG